MVQSRLDCAKAIVHLPISKTTSCAELSCSGRVNGPSASVIKQPCTSTSLVDQIMTTHYALHLNWPASLKTVKTLNTGQAS